MEGSPSSVKYYPSIKNTLVLQEVISSPKAFSQEELTGIYDDERARRKYEALKACNERYQEYRQTFTPLMYMKNLACVGTSMCPEAMFKWAECIKTHKSHPNDVVENCGVLKRKLERCMQSSCQRVVNASQRDMF